MTGEEMEQPIKNLLIRITRARDCFELYRYLIQSQEKHLDAMNISPAFSSSQSILYSTLFMIELAKLY